ncbi:phenylalanine--tRNA ligase subunit beta [Patescibacteria group bacterium AH-259-L07]|nr:phenylalanine--tRNA ligase subunit beta [Patescibacteria group bacterium AH-259-L07]
MRLSYKWLQELTHTRRSPEKLAELLNMHVASVEGVEDLSQGLDNVVVGEIIKIKPHPRADKLQLAMVKTVVGKKTVLYLVVCGAPNIAVGQKVPLALEGARLADGSKLETCVIRGVKSQGMLCAEDELGIGDDHTGIYILSSGATLGQNMAKTLGLDDIILEIENKSITRRPDLFNHYGFAREIGAITNTELRIKNSELRHRDRRISKPKIRLDINVEDKKLCPRYMAVVMDKIKVGPSPEWMQSRLRSIGLRPINNIVDITNYVMMEFGQPLHVFDKDKISRGIIVRFSKQGEKLRALDGEEYRLSSEDIVIADNKGPIALAGIMGGEASGVNELSKTIIIESANFNPIYVRKTSWRLGLRSDSALRFEKSLPLTFAKIGLLRAIELIRDKSQGSVVSRIYDIKSTETARQLKQIISIDFDCNRARAYIGESKIENKEMTSILKRLGCNVTLVKEKAKVTIPSYRKDLRVFEDLVEEVVRIYGADKIVPAPIVGEMAPSPPTRELVLEKDLKNILAGCGFDEVYNYSFYGADAKNTVKSSGKHISIANPLNADQQYLRRSLIPGLIKNKLKNDSYFSEFKLFEIGNVFEPQERKKIAGLIKSEKQDLKFGNKNIKHFKLQGSSERSEERFLYFAIKGIIELILKQLGIDFEKLNYVRRQSHSIDILLGKTKLGFFDFPSDGIAIFELDFEKLLRFKAKTKIYFPISQYPPIKRDLAFLIDKKVAWGQVKKVIKDIDPLIDEIELFDIYESKRFGDKRNIAFHIVYQSYKRTLKSEEIDKIKKNIVEVLEQEFKAQLRDF